MKHTIRHRPETFDLTVETLFMGHEMDNVNIVIVNRIVEKIADALSAEIFRLHKGKFVKLVMQNPGLLRATRLELIKKAEKVTHSHSDE